MNIKVSDVYVKKTDFRSLIESEAEYLLEYYVIQDFIDNKVKYKHYKFLTKCRYYHEYDINLLSSASGSALLEEIGNTHLSGFEKDSFFPVFTKHIRIESKNTENFYSEVLSKEQVSNSVLDKNVNLNANLKIHLSYAVSEKFDIHTDSFTGEKEIYGVSYRGCKR